MFTNFAFPTFIALTLSALAPSASAASFYWDGTDSNSTANGGAGTWDNVSTNWDTANSGGANIAWGGTIGDSGSSGSTLTTSAFSSGATSITLASVDGVTVGSTVSGTGIAAGTIVTAINTGTRVVTISPAATGAGTNGQTMTVSGVVNLTSILKNGSGNSWTLSGASTFTGQTKVNGGTLNVTSLNSWNGGTPLFAASALGAPTTLANATIAVGASTTGGLLNYTGTGETTDRIIDMAGTTGTPSINQSGTGLLKFTSDIGTSGVGSKALTLGGATTGTGEISGVIANGFSGTTQMISGLSSGNTTVSLSSVDGVTVGSTISGVGLADGTTITAINTTSRVVTISPAATGTGQNGQMMTVSGVVNLTSISKNGSGTWTLSGANNYTGVTSVNAGTLVFPKKTSLYQGNSAAWNTTNIVVNSGGTLGLNIGGSGEFTTDDIAYFDSLGSSTGGLKTGAALGLDTTNAGGSFTYSGNIVNAGTSTATGLTKLGTGILVLTGTNTYGGSTRIDGGTLSVPSLASLPSGAITIGGTATLAVAGAYNYGQAISGSGKITVATATGSSTTSLSGGIGSFTGIVEVSPATTGGKLQMGPGAQSATLPSSATVKVLEGATLYYSSGFTYAAAVQLYGGSTGEALGQLRVENGTVSGPVTLKANSSLGASNGFNGAISGAIGDEGNGFGFVKLGTSMITLTGANTYKGQIVISNGTLRANSFNSVSGGTTSSGLGAPLTVANGTISLGDTTTSATLTYGGTGETTDRVINLAGTTGGATLDQSGSGLLKFTSALTVTGAGNKTLTLQGGGNGELAGSVGDGAGTTAVTKTGSGIWTLSGANSYTGATNSNGGTLVYANAAAVSGTGRNIFSSTNGAIAFDYNTSLQTLLTTRIASGSTGGLALTSNNNLAENLNFATAGYGGYLGAKDNVTYTGTLTSNGSNVRLGNQNGGMLTLTASNIVSGTSNLYVNGNVTFTNPQTYTGTTNFTTNAGTFNGGGSVIDVSKVTFGAGATLTNLDLTGSGSLIKANNSTLTLDCANSYTGGTPVTQGLFIISNNAAFGTGAVTLATTGSNVARIQLTNGVSIANTLNLGANTGISGRGDLEINNTSSTATWSGPINITANPTNGGHFYTDATSTLTVSGPITSSVPVSFRAGNFIIPSASTSSYSTIYISGSLKIGSHDSLVKTSDVVLGNSAAATLDLNGCNQTVNTITKSTNAATITNTAATASELTISNSAASSYTGIIANGTGGVSLVKNGAGDLTLGGANTYTGSTTVNAGTLILGASTLADSSTVSIATGAKLSIATASDTVTHLFLDGVQMAAGTYGATGSGAAHFDDAHFAGTGKLTVLSSSASYTAWAAAKGLTTTNLIASADPDNDGTINLAEFAFNTSPLSADLPRTTSKVVDASGVRRLTLTLAVRNGATFIGSGELVSAPVDGVTYTIQGGPGLSDWSAVVTEMNAVDAAAVQVDIPVPEAGWTNRTFSIVTTGQTNAFMRARVRN